jgi:hypothetical protein
VRCIARIPDGARASPHRGLSNGREERNSLAVAGAIIVAAVGWLAYRVTTARNVYTHRLRYTTLPADDEALSAWLQAQPGVVTSSVTREGDAVVVTFTMWALILGAGPDVIGEASRFGYTGLGSIETRIAGGMTLW